jgi:hypothetical protein
MPGRGNPEKTKPFRWKKGCPSPNPGGRPRRNPVSDRYAEMIERALLERERKNWGLDEGATWGDALAMEQVAAAARGKTEAAREVREAIEGKATQRISGADGQEVRIRVIYDTDETEREEPNNGSKKENGN